MYKKDSLGYGAQCKACNHPLDDEIDKLILEGYDNVEVVQLINSKVEAQELGNEHLLIEMNVSTHKNKHVAPVRQVAIDQKIKDAALDTYDSIKMLTDTIKSFDVKFEEVYDHLKFDDPASFSRNVNAIKGLYKMKHDLIKLNSALLDDTKASKEVIDLNKVTTEQMLEMFKRVNKIAKGEFKKGLREKEVDGLVT